jgi:hypothetical protein
MARASDSECTTAICCARAAMVWSTRRVETEFEREWTRAVARSFYLDSNIDINDDYDAYLCESFAETLSHKAIN